MSKQNGTSDDGQKITVNNPTSGNSQSVDVMEVGKTFADLAAARSGIDPEAVDNNTIENIGRLAVNQATEESSQQASQNSISDGNLSSRQAFIDRHREMGDMIHGPGQQYNGKRDIWGTLGYPDPEEVSPAEYIRRAQNQEIANTIVTKPVETTWRENPEIKDAGSLDVDEQTAFENDIEELLDGEHMLHGLLHYLEWADRVQRPVRFGALLMGFDDGQDLELPVDSSNLSSPSDLRYLRPLTEADVIDWRLASEVESYRGFDDEATDLLTESAIRPDQPVLYAIRMRDPNASSNSSSTQKRWVHHTRLVHIVEQPGDTEWTGQSCLQVVLHRLIDFEKVLGASAEMFFTGADRKFYASSRGKPTETASQDEMELFDQQIREMIHGMRPALYGENIDLEVIDGQEVDPSGLVDAYYKSIAGSIGMPQNMLTGNELGDRATSEDRATWYGRIKERQQQFAEPVILRSVIDKLRQYGVISYPDHEDGEYEVIWPTLFEEDAASRAERHRVEAQMFKTAEEAIAMGANREVVYERLGIELDESHDYEPREEGDQGGEFPEEQRPVEEEGDIPEEPSEGERPDDEPDSTGEATEGLMSTANEETILSVTNALQDPENRTGEGLLMRDKYSHIYYLKMDVNVGMDDLDEVYENYHSITNMTASQVRDWMDTESFAQYNSSSDGDAREACKRNISLLEKPKSEWKAQDVRNAQRCIDFHKRHEVEDPDETVSGGSDLTPSAAGHLSWARDPVGAVV